jgi:hypothetical protein
VHGNSAAVQEARAAARRCPPLRTSAPCGPRPAPWPLFPPWSKNNNNNISNNNKVIQQQLHKKELKKKMMEKMIKMFLELTIQLITLTYRSVLK